MAEAIFLVKNGPYHVIKNIRQYINKTVSVAYWNFQELKDGYMLQILLARGIIKIVNLSNFVRMMAKSISKAQTPHQTMMLGKRLTVTK